MEIASRKILIVDDERGAREGLADLIATWGHETAVAEDGRVGLAKIAEFRPHIVISDLSMPVLGGMDLLKELKTDPKDRTAVIVLTAHGSIDSAVEAIRVGAYDFLTKPVDIVRLRILLEKITQRIHLEEEVDTLRDELQRLRSFEHLIGTTPEMKEIFRQIKVVAPSTASILIGGPSGTGKELVARGVHNRSTRAKKAFVAINCSAIPLNLLESELFGHEKGSFTGAIARKEGCFELANGGTLFLDEVGDMPFELQAKLLRVLEDGTFRRVGGRDELTVDVRVIAATNKDLKLAISRREFREDLFYRLNVFGISLPPLSERAEDIPLLALHFIGEFAAKNRKQARTLTPDAVRALSDYSWPGNVRELKNVIERAVILSEGEYIGTENLPSTMVTNSGGTHQIVLPLGCSMKAAEKEIISRTLRYCGNNRTRAAKSLGISLKTLHNKLNLYGLRAEETPDALHPLSGRSNVLGADDRLRPVAGRATAR